MRAALLPCLILAALVGPTRPAAAQIRGGIPSGTASPQTITISIVDAISRALEHNLGVLLADDQLSRARGKRLQELADLLPNVSARVSETRQQNNLQAFGFGSFKSPFGDIPNIVGPFNVFDTRVYLTHALLDFGALNSTRSEAHNIEASRHRYQRARDLVVSASGTLYVQALAALARADAAKVQHLTAEALHRQAVDLKQGGLVAGIDVLRAEVELNVQSQRATGAATDLEKVKLRLAYVMGLPQGQAFSLDPMLPELPQPDMTLEQAVERALVNRADYQAAVEDVRAAEAKRQAVIGDTLPAVRISADVGEIGLTPKESRGTFSVTGAVHIPIFQGGRVQGRLAEANADLRSRRAELEEMKASIYYEIRSAYLDVQTTSEQLQVATKTRDLAARQLTQSRDRFGAGVASNIEIVQAQEAVALANEQYIAALYGYDLAKGTVLSGVGLTAATLRQLTGGTR